MNTIDAEDLRRFLNMKNVNPVYDIGSLTAVREDDIRKDDILVSRFGAYSKSHQLLHNPHRHNFYHIVLFTEGAGTHSIDFENFEVKPWGIYFMVPGQVHSWNFEGSVDGYVVNFSSTYFQSFVTDYLQKFNFFKGRVNDSVLYIPADGQSSIKALFEEILNAFNQHEIFKEDFIKVLLLKMFIAISDLVVINPVKYVSSYNNTLFKNFQQLIEQNYTSLRLPREYAQLLYITTNHLNSLCNDLLGIPAGEVIRNRVILEAKRLLVNLDLSIAEISYRLNFNDTSCFNKFFKKYVGNTPEEFRKDNVKQKII